MSRVLTDSYSLTRSRSAEWSPYSAHPFASLREDAAHLQAPILQGLWVPILHSTRYSITRLRSVQPSDRCLALGSQDLFLAPQLQVSPATLRELDHTSDNQLRLYPHSRTIDTTLFSVTRAVWPLAPAPGTSGDVAVTLTPIARMSYVVAYATYASKRLAPSSRTCSTLNILILVNGH